MSFNIVVLFFIKPDIFVLFVYVLFCFFPVSDNPFVLNNFVVLLC